MVGSPPTFYSYFFLQVFSGMVQWIGLDWGKSMLQINGPMTGEILIFRLRQIPHGTIYPNYAVLAVFLSVFTISSFIRLL
jgi:hypothetical protein